MQYIYTSRSIYIPPCCIRIFPVGYIIYSIQYIYIMQCFVFALAFDIWTLYARHVLVLHWTFLCVLAPYGVVHFNIG